MGNICACCGYEEDYKHGAWYGGDDIDHAENHNVSFNEDDEMYDDKAQNREHLILLHEKHKRNSLTNGSDSNVVGSSRIRNRRTRLKRTTTLKNIDSSYQPPRFDKADETIAFLLASLDGNFVFDSIDEETRVQFVMAMEPQEFGEGDWIMRQGDVGDYFYIVEEGEIAFHVKQQARDDDGDLGLEELNPQVGSGSKGSTFGELALLYNTPRAASVRVLSSKLKLYKIDQLTFQSLLTSRQLQDRSNIISLVEKLDIFNGLDEIMVHKLVDAVTPVEFDAGERIVNKGDEGNLMYIVKSGQVKIDDIGHGRSAFKDQLLGVGDSFGERALITGETRAANVTAVTQPSVLLAISKTVLEELLGPLSDAILRSSHAKYLRSIPIFVDLEPEEIDRCANYLREERLEKGDEILTSGKLYLIQEGRALMTMHGEGKNGGSKDVADKGATAGSTLVALEKGDYFGTLDSGSKKLNIDIPQSPAADYANLEDTINIEEDMVCLTLLATDVQKVIGDLKRVSVSGQSSHELVKSKKRSTNRNVLNLSKLDKCRILGMGTFGKVWLVTPNSTKTTKDEPTPYALKMISKRQLLQQRLATAVMRERNVMESLVHPFLQHMVSSFQDENYLYFVLDLILGGELFQLIYPDDKQKAHKENEEWKMSPFYKSFGLEDDKKVLRSYGVPGTIGVRQAVFYSACIIDAFAYMHNRRIVYRDLKPENVLINSNGYVIVVDMGFAKVVPDKTFTMCGTPEYIAPEIVTSLGHNHSADHWSFGCLLYELIVGQTPFYDAGLDQLSMLKLIVKAQYNYPTKIAQLSSGSGSGLNDSLCHWKDLVSRLLKSKMVERIGNLRNGICDILDHDWFANIDFNELRSHGVPGPWLPSVKDPLDKSNFDGKFAREEKSQEKFYRNISEKDQAVFQSF